MPKSAPILVLACSVLALGASFVASGPANSDQLTADEVVGLVRQMNTTELNLYRGQQGKHQYASLAKMLESPDAKTGIKISVVAKDETSGEANGYLISVIASADGRHYLLEAVPKECGEAFFSSEVGLIYPAKALGCP